MPNRAASLALAMALAIALPAAAQTLYKWTDPDGKTHYSDKPPKGFKGTVSRIETEPAPPAAPPAAAPPKPVTKAGEEPAAAPQDMNSKRRAERLRLEARVVEARRKLEAARKARDEGEEPQQDERQVVQRARSADPASKGTARMNCREVPGRSGRKETVCGAVVPGEAYYERINRMDEAVRQAEEELATAERDYRRGMD